MTCFTRRDLIKGATAAAALPGLSGALRWLPGGDDRCLLVLELAGGNDGVNTLVPVETAEYRAARPRLGLTAAGTHDLGGGYALHSAFAEIHALLRAGQGTVVHGVGYPDPDRSHFRSRDIWHTADPAYRRRSAATTGWLGRAADWLADRGAAVPGLSVGSLGVPLMLAGRHVVVPSLQRVEDYQLLVDPAGGLGEARRRELEELVSGETANASDLDRFVSGVAQASLSSAEKMQRALAAYRPKAEYPDGDLGRSLQLAARVLISGFGTRLFHVSQGGFDTHARQLPGHAALLAQVSRGIAALVADLAAHRALEQTTILVFSEFGRRLAENQSQGTDHGAAGPVFLFGADLKPGPLGAPPSLTELDDGDLIATCDFRDIYGAVLRRLAIDDAAVLGAGFGGIELFG